MQIINPITPNLSGLGQTIKCMELFDQDFLNKVAQPKDNRFEMCLDFARKWVSDISEPFTSEYLIKAYKDSGNPMPKEIRVFGAVMKSLQRSKLIKHNGYGTYQGKQGHGKPCSIWVRVAA